MQTALWVAAAMAALGTIALAVRARRASPERLAAIRDALERGALLVDVRSPGEFGGGHLEGAVNVPVDQIGAKAASLGGKDRPIVVYCASGMRSARAAGLLRGAGFGEVHDLGGIRNGASLGR